MSQTKFMSKFQLTSEDLEKSEEVKKALILALHAYKCLIRHVAITSGSPVKQRTKECDLKECEKMKLVLQHMKSCRKGEQCTYDRCWYSRRIVSHYNNCTEGKCCICSSVRATLQARIG